MKKVLYSLVLMMTFMFLPNVVSATTANVTIKCNDVTAGGTATCTLTGSSSGNPISTVGANISISGGSFVSFSKGSGWAGDAEASNFLFYTDTGKSGSWSIGTLKVKASNKTKVTVTLSNIEVGDNVTGDMIKVGNKTGTINIKTTTKKSTTSMKPTTSTSRSTINPNFTTPSTSSSTSTTTRAQINTQYTLTSVRVGEFNVEYNYGIYTVSVTPETSTVNVEATGPEGSRVIGTGTKTLNVGNNLVELTLIMPTGETSVFPLYILRPDPNKQVETKLRNLKVVGYDIKFNPDQKEYTVTVPFGCKEIYIDYETYDKDVVVAGAGTISLNSGTNTFYIKSAYGTIASTEYSIKVKKNYLTIVLIVIIVLLCGGIGGMLFYYFNEKKKENTDANNAKNKAVADVNRAELAKEQQVSFNGQSALGTGRRTVAPTVIPKTDGVTPVAPQDPLGTPTVNPTPNPVQNGIAPQPVVNNNPQVVASTQIASVTPPTAPQVKVIKKILTSNTPNVMNTQNPTNAVTPNNNGINNPNNGV